MIIVQPTAPASSCRPETPLSGTYPMHAIGPGHKQLGMTGSAASRGPRPAKGTRSSLHVGTLIALVCLLSALPHPPSNALPRTRFAFPPTPSRCECSIRFSPGAIPPGQPFPIPSGPSNPLPASTRWSPTAPSIRWSIPWPNRTMYLFGKGSIRYKELGLKAEHININWDNATLHAEGISRQLRFHRQQVQRPSRTDRRQ